MSRLNARIITVSSEVIFVGDQMSQNLVSSPVTYSYYLGYHMRMHYGYVRYLASSIQVQLTWTLNTSFVLEVKNKVSISNTESLLIKGLFLWLRLIYI